MQAFSSIIWGGSKTCVWWQCPAPLGASNAILSRKELGGFSWLTKMPGVGRWMYRHYGRFGVPPAVLAWMSSSSQLQGDKRTKIDVMPAKQKIEMGTALRWVPSPVQLADGMTNTAPRQLMADRLRTHEISLQAHCFFQASKKERASVRRNVVRIGA